MGIVVQPPSPARAHRVHPAVEAEAAYCWQLANQANVEVDRLKPTAFAEIRRFNTPELGLQRHQSPHYEGLGDGFVV